MQPKHIRTMKTYCESRSNQKYAANTRHADHTGKRQRFYQRFLFMKKAVCSRVPKFAAYFRSAFPKVW